MSRENEGKMYFDDNEKEKSGNWRLDKDEEDSKEGKGNKDPKKLAKKLRNRGGRTFVLDKTKGKGGEYKEV